MDIEELIITIEDWSIDNAGRLHGVVYGHPYIQDGHRATTTTIQEPIYKNDILVKAKTKNNLYVLGLINPWFDKMVKISTEADYKNTKILCNVRENLS